MTTHSVTQALEECFDKSLTELPRKLRQIAEAHIPNWDDLPARERSATALNIDEYCAAWIDSELRIEFWWNQDFVSAKDAATLLYGQKPRSTETPGKSDTFNDAGGHETTPEDFDHLIKVFKNHERDEPAKHTMNDWFTIVENANRQYKGTLEPKRGMKYHCWIDAWLAVNTDNRILLQVSPAEPVTLAAVLPAPLPIEDAKRAAWIVKAREIADEIGLKKWRLGERQITARNICNAVATELAKGEPNDAQRYHGSQGPRAADAIRSVALKGWRFICPSGTTGINGTDEIAPEYIPH